MNINEARLFFDDLRTGQINIVKSKDKGIEAVKAVFHSVFLDCPKIRLIQSEHVDLELYNIEVIIGEEYAYEDDVLVETRSGFLVLNNKTKSFNDFHVCIFLSSTSLEEISFDSLAQKIEEIHQTNIRNKNRLNELKKERKENKEAKLELSDKVKSQLKEELREKFKVQANGDKTYTFSFNNLDEKEIEILIDSLKDNK